MSLNLQNWDVLVFALFSTNGASTVARRPAAGQAVSLDSCAAPAVWTRVTQSNETKTLQHCLHFTQGPEVREASLVSEYSRYTLNQPVVTFLGLASTMSTLGILPVHLHCPVALSPAH